MKFYRRKDIKRIKKRFKKRRKKKRDYRKTLRNLFRTFFSTLLIAATAYFIYSGYCYLTHTPYLYIKYIKCSGLEVISEDELIEIIDLKPGTNILAIKLKEISRRLESHPWVEDAMVKREFPQGILIKIKERKPVAIVSRDGIHYLDHKGTIFARVAGGDSMDFPILTGFGREDGIESDEKLQTALKSGLALIEEMEKEGIFLKKNISEIHWSEISGLTIFTSDLVFQIKIGRANFRDKLNRLKYTIDTLKRDGRYEEIECINLIYQNQVVVRMKKEGPG